MSIVSSASLAFCACDLSPSTRVVTRTKRVWWYVLVFSSWILQFAYVLISGLANAFLCAKFLVFGFYFF